MINLNLTKRRKILLVVALIAISLLSVTGALVVLSLKPQKASTYTQDVVPSDLVVVSLTHVVSKDKIKSTLILSNPTGKSIDAYIVLYYEPDVADKNMNVTVASGATETFKITAKTDDAALFEYATLFISEYK
jgi:hypothetical protein